MSVFCLLRPVLLFPLLQCFFFSALKQTFLPQLPLQIQSYWPKLFSAKNTNTNEEITFLRFFSIYDNNVLKKAYLLYQVCTLFSWVAIVATYASVPILVLSSFLLDTGLAAFPRVLVFWFWSLVKVTKVSDNFFPVSLLALLPDCKPLKR